ncbi:DUF3604 domain-containing protein [Haliea atlantica]
MKERLLCLAGTLLLLDAAWAADKELLWGDTHVHSSYSMDASYNGNTLSPEDAYRFAMGEPVEVAPGSMAQLDRPLDFLVVADHAEQLGVIRELRTGNPVLLEQASGKRWYALLQEGGEALKQAFMTEGGPQLDMSGVEFDPWADLVGYAEAYNKPGRFTTFAGFEWTSTPGGNNLHRNVIFRDGPEKTLQVQPFSFLDSAEPERLWAYLEEYEARQGGRVLAIPHNSNVSGGQMFPLSAEAGAPLSRQYLQSRKRWEPIVEVTQMKGDSETHPFLSPNDEFADFGRWDKANITGQVPHADWMFPYEYVRSALKNGLYLEASTGINPYQFGMIGSTDSHTALATADEDNFWGKFAYDAPSATRIENEFLASNPDARVYAWEMLASGYAAVWAEANTREAIFDAMMRREVYATTGPRISVSFYGGWNDEIDVSVIPHRGAPEGFVPMGGELHHGESMAAGPVFVARAVKDASGANLDRLQIVKGWLEPSGKTREKVFDVAWAGDRELDKNGQLPALPSTVDPHTAQSSDEVGARTLEAVWTDPEFDPEMAAFYYLRVLQVHTPTWPLYDKVQFGAVLPDAAPAVQQERAYTSPIWYQTR